MSRTAMALLALLLASAATNAQAEAISTTSCKAASDRTMTKDGKNYSCTSCETCTTSTCQTGGALSCTNTTKTSCSCTEVTATGPKPQDGVVAPGNLRPGVLDPGRRPKRVRPMAPLDGLVTQ